MQHSACCTSPQATSAESPRSPPFQRVPARSLLAFSPRCPPSFSTAPPPSPREPSSQLLWCRADARSRQRHDAQCGPPSSPGSGPPPSDFRVTSGCPRPHIDAEQSPPPVAFDPRARSPRVARQSFRRKSGAPWPQNLVVPVARFRELVAVSSREPTVPATLSPACFRDSAVPHRSHAETSQAVTSPQSTSAAQPPGTAAAESLPPAISHSSGRSVCSARVPTRVAIQRVVRTACRCVRSTIQIHAPPRSIREVTWPNVGACPRHAPTEPTSHLRRSLVHLTQACWKLTVQLSR
mmetsp:Transcript_60085/g.159825  ORF Transcript_60085/g.159825 Transcript_60085/m.159825 type:complete len:294 (+) Transcript_60085:90-971(+)